MSLMSYARNLQSHAFNDELHREVLSISRNAALESRASSVVLAELVDQVPHDCVIVLVYLLHCGLHVHGKLTLVEHGGPDSSDAMNNTNAVDVGVCVGVGGKTGGVGVCANAGRGVINPGTHRVVLSAGIARLQADGGGHEVTPALTHTTGLKSGQAVAVGGATSETVGDTISD
jgi:hypothetical protein